MIEGQGRSIVGAVSAAMVPFGSTRHSIEEKWYVIDRSVPHEFFPERENMTVVSFHTCEATELEEVDCETGGTRLYEPSETVNGPVP